MQTIVSPFIEQFETIKDACSHKSKVILGTMGPESTSSVQAAKYFCKGIGSDIQYEFKLYSDFMQVLDGIKGEESIDFVLVPSAYERITDFFLGCQIRKLHELCFPDA